jgi:hypothetical protein
MMKKKLIFIAILLMFVGCKNYYINGLSNETKVKLIELEQKLDNNTRILQAILDIANDDVSEDIVVEKNTSNRFNTINYKTSDNVGALNKFLKDNNYKAKIGYNFNTDKRGDDLLFTIMNESRMRGFGIVQNGVVRTMEFDVKYSASVINQNNKNVSIAWNGNYIVLAVNGGMSGDCGFFGYTMQGRDFSTLTQTWENKKSSVRYAGIRTYSEIVDNTYYVSVLRVNRNTSVEKLNMKTGEIIFIDENEDSRDFLVSAKVNNLYYGVLIKDNYSTYIMASAPQYYNISNNYKTIRSDLTPKTLRWCNYSYTKRRMAIIDFTDGIARPIYLTGITDKSVPATLTTIPEFEYKGKYYEKIENSKYAQFEEVKLPYNLFDDKYIKIK